MGEFNAELFNKLADGISTKNGFGTGDDLVAAIQKRDEFKSALWELIMLRARDFLTISNQKEIAPVTICLSFTDGVVHPKHGIDNDNIVAPYFTDTNIPVTGKRAEDAVKRLAKALVPCA